MVGISADIEVRGLMLYLCDLHRSVSSLVFAFGACKLGWYHRCLGLDPVNSDVVNPFRLSEAIEGERMLIHSFLVFGFGCVEREGEKMLIDSIKQQRKSQGGKGDGRRLLISINVMGSPGPIRFVVSEDELVGSVIGKALRSYARQGRLPVLGSDSGNFLLYCANAEPEALSPWETIGSRGARNFLLWKKQKAEEAHEKSPPSATGRKGSESWKVLKALIYQSRKKESADINQNHNSQDNSPRC